MPLNWENSARTWERIESAPKDGTRFYAKSGSLKRLTWWGKASHVPLYGWCHGPDPENIDLWAPSHWKQPGGKTK